MPDIYELIAAAENRGEPFALGIISEIKGSSPQKKGAKALFYLDGRIEGTLGGGCLEAEVQQRARQALLHHRSEAFELVLDHDFGWDDGLICGGKVSGLILAHATAPPNLWRQLAERGQSITWGVGKDFNVTVAPQAAAEWLYQETVTPRCALWIAGAGHVAQAVTPLALRLDFEVTVLDDRAALVTERYFPGGTHFRVDYWEKLLQDPLPARPTFGLIVTRGHQHDALALKHWIHRPFVLLGMIGSRRKKRIIFEQFVEEQIATPDALARVACPVGLDLLAHSVEEIALSITAQYVLERARQVYGRVSKNPAGLLGQPLALAPEQADSLNGSLPGGECLG
jgi:xanthine dehydrogenase accessory factor